MVRLWRTLSAAVVALGGLSAPWSARADDAPSILLLTYQGMGAGVPPELREQTAVVIKNELEAAGLSVTTAADVVESAAAPTRDDGGGAKDAPTGDPSAGDQAQELIARAKIAMEDQEISGAIKQLKKAVKLLDDNGDAVPDLRLLSEAYLQLSIAYFMDGDEDEAEDHLTKSIHYDPFRELSESEFPPIFIRTHQRARFFVLKRPRARIEVKAKSGAQVLFDGKNVGKAPLALSDVLPGNHWVRVESPGEPVRVKRVLVRGNKTIAVEFDGADGDDAPADDAPAGVLGGIARNEVTRSHVAQLREAGKRQSADYVLFGGIYKTDTAYKIYTLLLATKDGEVGRLVDIAFDLDLLSAQIEVYKLAEDVKKEIAAKKLSRVEEAAVFPVSAKVSLRSRKRRAPAADTRVTTVAAAPPPLASDEPPAIAAAAPPPPPSRTPAAVGAVTPAPEPKGPSVVPKDEEDDPKTAGALVVAPPIEDPKDDKDGGGLWWVWVVVGVVAAGAAGAGSYLAISNQSPDEGRLLVRWDAGQ
jgi:tetratricopeptide (TPR) repeat protein